jgi:hypothetical protein
MMLVLLEPDTLDSCQQPSAHYSVAVYCSKDDNVHMRANLATTLQDMKTMEDEGLEIEGYRILPHFILPADMATHWSWFNAGGVHDELFRHRCSCPRGNRACIYDWYVLPDCPH